MKIFQRIGSILLSGILVFPVLAHSESNITFKINNNTNKWLEINILELAKPGQIVEHLSKDTDGYRGNLWLKLKRKDDLDLFQCRVLVNFNETPPSIRLKAKDLDTEDGEFYTCNQTGKYEITVSPLS